MTDHELNELKKKVDTIDKRSLLDDKRLSFLFQAAMPIVIAVIGIYFTYTNNSRQIEFQQISVADGLVAEVKNDPNFTKDELDLKLEFVEKMFADKHFKEKVKELLTETFAVTLSSDALKLEEMASSSDPEDIQYVQSRITEAKKFGDTSVNNVVKKLETNDAIKNASDAGAAKQKARDQLQTGTVDDQTINDLKTAQMRSPKDSSINRLLKKAEQNRQRKNSGTTTQTDQNPQPADTTGTSADTTAKKKNPAKKRK